MLSWEHQAKVHPTMKNIQRPLIWPSYIVCSRNGELPKQVNSLEEPCMNALLDKPVQNC